MRTQLCIIKHLTFLVGALLFLHDGVASQPASTEISVSIPFRPTVVRTVSGNAVVYELNVQNLVRKSAPQIAYIEVFESGRPTPIFRLEGDALARAIAKEGSIINPSYLGQSGRAVIYMWIPLEKVSSSLRLRNRVYFSDSATRYSDSLAVDVDSRMVVIGSPVGGDNWYVGQGPGNNAMHRRFVFPFDGTRPRLSQRFAIDIGRVAPQSENFAETRGDPKKNESWVAYGQPVIAVADARVSAMKDEIPENTPGSASFAVPINLETVMGNRLILDIGGGRFVLYGHLRPGSIKVKVGEKVRKGQVLAEIGNSGRSNGPHLHFQVTDASSPMDAEGLPFVFDRFTVLGTCGDTDCTPTPPRLVRRSHPVTNQLLGFPNP